MVTLFLRCVGVTITILLCIAAPKLYEVTGTHEGGSTPAFVTAFALVVLGQIVATIRAQRLSDFLAEVVSTHPILCGLLLANLALMTWLVINVSTRLGSILLLFAWGVGLLALCIGTPQRVIESCSKLVRLSPMTFISLYFMFAVGEAFLRYNPLLVGGGGGGNPALGRIYAGLYKINSHGFRGAEFSTTPTPGVVRIVMLGDSFTFGQGVAEGKTYPRQMNQLLNSQGSRQRYEVLNCGQSGTDTFEQLTRLRERCLGLQPDLVTVQFYLNDLEPRMQATEDANDFVDDYLLYPAHSSYAVFFLKYRFERLRDNVKAGIHETDQSIAWVDAIAERIETDDAGWQRFEQAVEGFAEVSRREQIPIVFVLLPHPGLNDLVSLRSVHETVRQRVAVAGLHVLDFFDVWSALSSKDQIVSEIDHHPSALAHELTAARLAQELQVRNLLVKRESSK